MPSSENLAVENGKNSASLMRKSWSHLSDAVLRARYSIPAGAKAHFRRYLKRPEVSPVWISPSLLRAKLVLVLILRNECLRMPHFLDYYRGLGVEHFIFVDNGSTDGLEAFLRGMPDVTLFNAKGLFAKSRYGIDWVNDILTRYCVDKWVLMADADEYLVYPFMDRVKLPELVAALAEQGEESMQCVMIDMYSRRPVSQNVLRSGQDPLEVCNLFDSTGYRRTYYQPANTTWIKGGVRGRLFFDDVSASPALNKTPLVYWRARHAFLKAAHEVWPPRLNGPRNQPPVVTGALLHFKFTNDFSQKVALEAARRQHTAEYQAYSQTPDQTDSLNFVSADTREYSSWRSLHEHGLVQCNEAFRRRAEVRPSPDS